MWKAQFRKPDSKGATVYAQFVLFAEIALLCIVWLFVSKVGAQTDLGESL